MLIVPHAHDQGDNAVRSARLGVARVVFPSQYKRNVVRDHLRALLTESSWKDNATTVSAKVRAEHGADRACEALEALASVNASDFASRPTDF